MNSPTQEVPVRRVLLEVERRLMPRPRIHYIEHPFRLPEGASKVGLKFSFHKEILAQLFISLHDPNGFRGNRMKPGAKGDVVLELWVTPNDASEGGLVGALPSGWWNAKLDIEALGEETDYRLEIYAEFGQVPEPLVIDYPADHVVRPAAGWYRGELHAHSTESDGELKLEQVVQVATDIGLDFLAMSEHFTTSQWRKMAALIDKPIALLRSCEITSHHGHANMHGLQEWIDVYVDRPGWDMNQAADAVHAQGGLFCVNHAFSGYLGWRAYDFDWSKADLMEIYHNLEGPNNHFQPPLWDHHLRLGRRIVGVGGIDSHHPLEGIHALGQLFTWVYAPELSEFGILQGLRGGMVYVSRGPELRFSAVNAAGQEAEMWQSLPLGSGPVTFRVQVRSELPLRVFVLRDGYFFDMLTTEAGMRDWQTLTFADDPQRSAYYRLEVHTIRKSEFYRFVQWRDFATTQALTNPIWVGWEEMQAPLTGGQN
jgi:hypothetical protein